MVDLEGTLTDHEERLRTLQERTQVDARDPTAWADYYKGLPNDKPRPHMVATLKTWISDENNDVIIYSTRFANKYNHEDLWLREHGLRIERVHLLQRQSHQAKIKGPDLVVEWAREFIPVIIVDDRIEVRERLQGLRFGPYPMVILTHQDFLPRTRA